MRALVFDGRQLEVGSRNEPVPAAGYALVRTRLAGLCNTDLEIARGYMGFRGVLGHELVGEVVDGPEPWRGARVVSEINYACGSCERCEAGLGRHCATRRVMGIVEADGAFAEYVCVPVANLHRVPDEVPDEAAVFCEPLAAAFEILEQLEVEGRSTIVLGDGKLGLLVAQVLARAGARLLAVGRHPDKLAILEATGIETTTITEFRPEASQADIVVDATGSAQGLAAAMAATRPRGTLILKSTLAEQPGLNLAPIVINEINLIGSRCGPFDPALRALASQQVEVAPLIEETYPLTRGLEAFEAASRKGSRKILIAPT